MPAGAFGEEALAWEEHAGPLPFEDNRVYNVPGSPGLFNLQRPLSVTFVARVKVARGSGTRIVFELG